MSRPPIPALACVDCLMFLANGEPPLAGTELARWVEDYLTAPDQRLHVMRAGSWAIGDHENDHEFSRSSCDVCRTRLAGSRHEVFWIQHTAYEQAEMDGAGVFDITPQEFDCDEACVYCFKDTAPGMGLFVDRIPAYRDITDDDGRVRAYLDGYMCRDCLADAEAMVEEATHA